MLGTNSGGSSSQTCSLLGVGQVLSPSKEIVEKEFWFIKAVNWFGISN